MHQIRLTRRDGHARTFDVSDSISPELLGDVIATFMAGDEDPPGWKVTEWEIAGGGTIKVSTPPLPGEVPGGPVHCARHEAFVQELQDQFPPV